MRCMATMAHVSASTLFFQISTIRIPFETNLRKKMVFYLNTWWCPFSHFSMIDYLSYFEWCSYTFWTFQSLVRLFYFCIKNVHDVHTHFPVMMSCALCGFSLPGYRCTFYGLSPWWENTFLWIRPKLKGRSVFHVLSWYYSGGTCWLHVHC
jgi:hypothetical protein